MPPTPPRSTGATAAAPGGGTAEDFGVALRELLAAAGGPTLTANAAGGDRVSVQKLSNWCAGRHLPDRFDTIAPVLLWLTVRTRESTSASQAAPTEMTRGRESAVRSIRDWYRLFISARHPSAATAMPLDLPARIGAAEYLLAHPEPDTALTAGVSAKEQLATAIMQLTGIDPATGDPVATDVPSAALPAEAAELLSATGLITTGASAGERASWVDPTIPLLWGRAAPLVEQYRPALAARTALLADAARWSTAPDPQNLYTWQQLTTCGRHLHTLPAGIIATPEQPAPYRFGDGVTPGHIPTAALPFWEAAQNAAQRQLTVHRLIMATVIGVIALAVIAGGIAGFLTS